MLILTRKRGQSIVINEDIFIRVLNVHGGYVWIGFEAPEKYNIVRTELIEEKHRFNLLDKFSNGNKL